MKISFQNTTDDFFLAAALANRLFFKKKRLTLLSNLMGGVLGFCFVFGAISIAKFYEVNPDLSFYELNFGLWTITIGIVISLIIYKVIQALCRKGLYQDGGSYLTTFHVEVTDRKIIFSHNEIVHLYPLISIKEIIVEPNYTLLFIDAGVAVYIPERAYKDQQEKELFISLLAA